MFGSFALGLALMAPVPAGAREPELVVVTADEVITRHPSAGAAKSDHKLDGLRPTHGALSPDRSRAVVATKAEAGVTLTLVECATGRQKILGHAQHLSALFWSADGANVVAAGLDVERGNQPQFLRHQCWLTWAVNAVTGTESRIEWGGEFRAAGRTRDGSSYVVVRTFDPKPIGQGVLAPQVETYLVEGKSGKKTLALKAVLDMMPLDAHPETDFWLVRVPAGNGATRVVGYRPKADRFVDLPIPEGEAVSLGAISPDGKAVALAVGGRVRLYDLATKSLTDVCRRDARVVGLHW